MTAQSPLFEPVVWEQDGFRILDESLLPDKIEYINVNHISQAVDAVRNMRTRAFGQVLTFLYSGALVAESYDGTDAESLRRSMRRLTRQFSNARPTFDFHGLCQFFERWLDQMPQDARGGDWIAAEARALSKQIVRARLARARRTAALLPAAARVLTHCNVSGELVAVAQYCKILGKEITFVATETRPYLQGARLTAWELARAGIRVSLIPDCGIAQVMAKGAVNAVVVGSDRTAQNGDIINKVGTYPLALMAKEHGIPFLALVQDPRSLATGKEVPIEERPPDELLSFRGKRLIDDDEKLQTRYPAFDVTPAALITHLIGFDRLYTPETFRRHYQQATASEARQPDGESRYLLVYGIPSENQHDVLLSALKAEHAGALLIPEMRPQLWGAHAVAPALLRRHAPTTLICDNTMGTLFAQGEIRKLYLYYSGLDEQGPRGICGSLLAVRLARAHGVAIELMPAGELSVAHIDNDVSTFMGTRISPAGVSILPLDTEIVPWELFRKDVRISHE